MISFTYSKFYYFIKTLIEFCMFLYIYLEWIIFSRAHFVWFVWGELVFGLFKKDVAVIKIKEKTC